jgi:uncharacterized membrane protein YeaQ/YmgE (transglycosylase-associated protein family)
VERRSWSPGILVGMVLGASLGALVVVALLRRWRRGTELRLTDIPWRDVISVVGPIVVLVRRLVELSRKELVDRDAL